MKLLTPCCFVLALTGACFAQQWELGAAGGIGIYKNGTVTGASQSADAGFKNGAALSAFVVQNLYKHLSGEFGYTFQFDDLKVSSGGTEATFTGQSHAVHYDLLFSPVGREAPVRPYIAGGGGIKVYRGTGTEQESQPLGQLVALTRTQEVKPLITFGAGLKFKVGRRGYFYLEARDYLTPFPSNVVWPVPPSKVSGWLHDFMPLAGFSIGF
jgi:hypothetical protein